MDLSNALPGANSDENTLKNRFCINPQDNAGKLVAENKDLLKIITSFTPVDEVLIGEQQKLVEQIFQVLAETHKGRRLYLKEDNNKKVHLCVLIESKSTHPQYYALPEDQSKTIARKLLAILRSLPKNGPNNVINNEPTWFYANDPLEDTLLLDFIVTYLRDEISLSQLGFIQMMPVKMKASETLFVLPQWRNDPVKEP